MTHTYALMQVSPSSFEEIARLLKDAGYSHAFVDDALDMHGLALIKGPAAKVTDPCPGNVPVPRSPLPWTRPNITGPFIDAEGAPVSFSDPKNAEYLGYIVMQRPALLEALREMVLKHPKSSRRWGGEGSIARRHQQDQELAIDFARLQLAKAGVL